MADHYPIARALLSVSDKSGLIPLATGLVAKGVELLSTGGTAKAIKDAGLPVTLVEQHTGFPEMMDGRLKTLHPKIHGGLLALRDDPSHQSAAVTHGIPPIDLVVVNLYPFRQTVADPNVSLDHAIENIDIGGPTMVRAAAKNHRFVAVATDPAQYASLITQISETGGTTLATRQRLAAEAFAHTAAYDAAIARWLAPRFLDKSEADFPAELALPFSLVQRARYGENPHQAAAIYADALSTGPSIVNARQLHGKELSYNNVNDAAAALDLAFALAHASKASPSIGAAVIKHANPCGAAQVPAAAAVGGASPVLLACEQAIAGDPLAAFGGILACTAAIDLPTAERLIQKDIFLEVLIAQDFTPEALAVLKARSANIRLLATGPLAHPPGGTLMYKSIPGGLLVQERDLLAPNPAGWTHAAGPTPTAAQLQAATSVELFVRAMSSNAIAIGAMVHANSPASIPGTIRLLGGGVGQVDRVTACRLAVEKCKAAGSSLSSAIAASDAFFPFPDGPRILIDAGVKMIIHPGGSKRDGETFDLCNAHNVTCLTTGVRRFRH